MHQIEGNKCPVCENGVLRQATESVAVEHNGVTGSVVSVFSTCNFCGSDQANAEQISANKSAMETFKRAVKVKSLS